MQLCNLLFVLTARPPKFTQTAGNLVLEKYKPEAAETFRNQRGRKANLTPQTEPMNAFGSFSMSNECYLFAFNVFFIVV